MPDRDRVADIEHAQRLQHGPLTVLDVIAALDEGGFAEVAGNIFEMQRQRVIGDYLQPAAIFDDRFHVLSALTDPNDYRGPGTGYRVEGERWAALQDLPQAWEPRTWIESLAAGNRTAWLEEVGPALPGSGTEVVIAVGPAFGVALTRTIGGLDHRDVLRAIVHGLRDEGVAARIVRVWHTSDCAFIGHAGAQLSGSRIAIGLQSKGTTVIHRRDLVPLENLELFAMAPNMDLETYRQIGRNAALYALGKSAAPIAVRSDNTARLRLIVQTTLLHRRETQEVQRERGAGGVAPHRRCGATREGAAMRHPCVDPVRGSGFSRTARGQRQRAA